MFRMNCKAGRAVCAAVVSGLLSVLPVQADLFVGSYTPLVEYDDNTLVGPGADESTEALEESQDCLRDRVFKERLGGWWRHKMPQQQPDDQGLHHRWKQNAPLRRRHRV